ncbi:MAG: aldehyde dehydrogenase (NADP(+)) [Phycisphaerales bacterium]
MSKATSQPTPRPVIQPTGRSLIAGRFSGGGPGPVQHHASKFYAVDPHSGRELPTLFLAASADETDRAAWAAWEAFHALSTRPATDRAALLDCIAETVLGLGEDLIGLASDETGLGPARLVSERDRTVNTLRLFAELVRQGDWVEPVIDTGQSSRRPIPKPDLRRMLRPLGPVAVFGAGNFPLAYSTGGGDTASALAAGCPVVVKGHPGHPGTGELVAQAIAGAVAQVGFDPGTFSFLHAGGDREMAVGEQLVRHPAIRAVGFTGSFGGGTALAALAAERPDPIPVFAEMGSTNPIFILPGAAEAQAEAIAERLVASATNSGGQMCTCPGLFFIAKGEGAEQLQRAMARLLNEGQPQTMLSARTRANFARRAEEVAGTTGVDVRAGSVQAGHRTAREAQHHADGTPIRASAALFRATFDAFKRSPALRDEVFGPAAILVVCDDPEQLVDAAAAIQGSLTGTIWAGGTDEPLARRIHQVLEQRVGRLIYNGVPTGVEVAAAMVHGGPFPATNQPQTTAVGPFAVRRWCRPVCYQNAPDAFLPAELRNGNPLRLRRLVNGEWTYDGVAVR